jgi:hypothetical protein
VVEQVKVSVLGLNAPLLSGQAAEMIPPGFVIPAHRLGPRPGSLWSGLRASVSRAVTGTETVQGASAWSVRELKEMTFCLAMPRCWWSWRIGRNFPAGRSRSACHRHARLRLPAALDLGGALGALASRGGA